MQQMKDLMDQEAAKKAAAAAEKQQQAAAATTNNTTAQQTSNNDPMVPKSKAQQQLVSSFLQGSNNAATKRKDSLGNSSGSGSASPAKELSKFEQFKNKYRRSITTREYLPCFTQPHLSTFKIFKQLFLLTLFFCLQWSVDYMITKDPYSEFTRLKAIGTGSTGNVFKAISVRTKEKVAIKIMTIKKDTRLDMYEYEILMMTKCVHENICKYYGTYYTENELWVCCKSGSRQNSFF